MTEIGLSLGTSHKEPIRRTVDLMSGAEEHGFSHAWIIDSQMTMKDTYVVQTLAFEHTDEIRLGPGVTNPKTRHETVTANVASDLQEVSDGRFRLGLSSGETSVRPIGQEPCTLRELRKSTEFIRGLLRGEEVERDGTAMQFKDVQEYAPIYLAGSGPKMLQLSGHFGDGVILMCAANAEIVESKLEHIYEGIERSGRSRDEVDVDLWVTVSAREDADAAVQDVKPWTASYAMQTRLHRDDYSDALEPHLDEMEAITEEYEMSDHLSLSGKHKEMVSDDLARTMAVGGDHDHVIERLNGLADLDVDALTLTLLTGGREDRLETLGQEILPNVA